ncbi:RecX family transcriptional regulator [Fructilactobacillus cliffordii]|uniref:Regulatory protein RecX n=1 Tax=Fructilactobacillus cliffordii TaxID=2940299 RepID=A0A9Q8ZTG1_9LACO|nr:RecX family transcriptional regulator [Fructilactobacillus cliffordii]USS89428.1 RecX family transcriptional regulator [Fructilactobacillus cliffordii]
MCQQSQLYKVTKVEAQKRPGRYNIYLDDEYAFPVSEEVLIQYHLFKGKTLTNSLIQTIQAADQQSKLFAQVVDFISYQSRTTAEVRTKLQGLTEDTDQIEAILTHLEQLALINDQQYAQRYVQQVALAGKKGPIAAVRYLVQKGISENLAHSMVAQFYPDDQATVNARPLAQKAFDQYARYPYNKRIEKTKLSLVRKGFTFATIDEALAELDDTVDETEQAALLEKAGQKAWHRYRGVDRFQRVQKVKQALMRQGFSFADIDQFLDNIEEQQ